MRERADVIENLAAFLLYRAPDLRRTLLRVLVVGVPLFFLPVTNDPFAVPKLGLLLAGVSLVGGLRIAEVAQGRRVNHYAMAVPVLATVGPLFVAWVFGPYRTWSLWGEYGRFLGLIPYLLLAVLGFLVADAFGGRLRDLGRSLLWAGAVAGGYAILQHFGIDVFDWATVRTSTIGNSNFTGGFLAIVLPVGLALTYAEEQDRPLMAALSALVLGGLLLTFSQGAWAAAGAGSVLVVGSISKPRFRMAPIATAALVALMMLALVVRVAQSMLQEQVDSASTTQLRGLWWETALQMAADAPILGHGPNAYAVEAPQYRSADEASVMGFDTSNDPHSVPLTFLTSAGAPGLLGFLILLGWAAWRWRAISDAGHVDLLLVGFAGGVAAYFVQSIVAVDEITVRFGLWVCLGALGAIVVTTKQQERPASKNQKGRKKTRAQIPKLRGVPVVSAAALAAVAGTLWGISLLVNDSRIKDAQTQARAGRADSARELFNKVGGLGVYDYRHKEGFYLGRLALAFQREGRTDVSEVFLNDALEAFSYLEDFPSVSGWRDRSSLLLAYSQADPSFRDQAIESYERALALDPHNATLQAEAAAAAAPPVEE